MNDRNVSIVTDEEGRKVVVIKEVRFRGRKIDWNEVKKSIKEYVGSCYEICETAEKIYIGNRLSDEFTGSEARIMLVGTVANAKANSSIAIPELIQIATNPTWKENKKEKHIKTAKYGWYRYETRFALPVYENDILTRYNIFKGQLLINHAENGKKYLYDILSIKKETSSPQQ